MVYAGSVRVGGDKFDESIINYIRRNYGMLIGETTAENIKKEIGSAFPGSEVKEMEVKGRNLAEGIPRSFTISSNEILEALTDPLNSIVSAVKSALEQTPPELGADIAEKGMLNRAIYSAYPPGSTFKPYMALGALELGKRTPSQAIMDPGFFNFGGHQFRDDKKGGHGRVDLYQSIVQSCDTYYYMLANDMGIDAISKFVGQFGFGQRTGVDIEGEAEGVLPSPAWKRRRFKRPEQQKWYAGETISIGIGQGYNAYTPIQLAQAVATLANDGVMYRPHLVKYITDARSGARTVVEPKPVRVIPLKPENIATIKRAMGIP